MSKLGSPAGTATSPWRSATTDKGSIPQRPRDVTGKGTSVSCPCTSGSGSLTVQFHCTSQPGIGTTIRATLPLEPRDDQPPTGGTGAHPRHHSEYRLPEEDFGHVHALAQSQH